jgi:hypothetical protein
LEKLLGITAGHHDSTIQKLPLTKADSADPERIALNPPADLTRYDDSS